MSQIRDIYLGVLKFLFFVIKRKGMICSREQRQLQIWLTPSPLQMVTAETKLNNACSLEEKL